MKQLYNFGITQDDYQIESQVLDLENSNLLCIASGGEIPLSIASLYNSDIMAIDVAEPQLKLCRLKLLAATNLEPSEAPGFLGFKKMDSIQRLKYYQHLKPYLSKLDSEFWNSNEWAIQKGVINCAKFEGYIRKFSPIFRKILGKKRLNELLEIDTISEQQTYFDKYLDKRAVKWIFEIAFSPLLYQGGALEKNALRHASRESLAENFYRKFRDFLVSTKAAENLYLQYFVLGEIKNDGALPAYLKSENRERLLKNLYNITFVNTSLQEALNNPETSKFKNFAISNISDWISEDEMTRLLHSISKNCISPSNICLRYLHKNPSDSEVLNKFQLIDLNTDITLTSIDRFPFYSNYLLKV